MDRHWERAYAKLLQFVEREGHCCIQVTHLEDGFALGRWIRRKKKELSKLSKERKQALSSVSGWTWKATRRPYNAKWEEGFERLLEYVEREGHSMVPRQHSEEEFHLGAWVAKQRLDHRKGLLLPNRKQRLEVLPFWIWETGSIQYRWWHAYSLMEKYVDRIGSAAIQVSHKEDSFQLGEWVWRQRRQKKSLPVLFKKKLEELPGWSWSAR